MSRPSSVLPTSRRDPERAWRLGSCEAGRERLLEGRGDDDGALATGLEILARRSTRLAPIAAELSSLAGADRLTAELASVVSSHVHMFVNRLLRSQHKRQEFVLYDYLDRIYESRLARLRRG